jgi:hypothetical protein
MTAVITFILRIWIPVTKNVMHPVKNLDYEDFLRNSAAMRVRETAVMGMPNPGDFFGVVVTVAGSVVAEVSGIVVAAAVGVTVNTTVAGAVVGLVVIAAAVGIVVVTVVGFVVGTLTPIMGLNSVLSILVFVLTVFPATS